MNAVTSTTKFFGIDPDDRSFVIGRARDNFRQMALDQLSLVRLISSLSALDVLPVAELDKAILSHHGCPPIPGATGEYFCHAMPLCPALSYCVLSAARMDVEQSLLRFAFQKGSVRKPICADMPHPENSSHVVTQVRNAGAKVIASLTRVDLIFDLAKFGSQDIKLELARDGG